MRLVLLHALPFDEQMWDLTRPEVEASYVPTLYGLGRSVEEWAAAILDVCTGEDLLVVGASVGGSCALEMVRVAPDRIRGLVLVGTKAGVRPDPRSRDEVVATLRDEGVEAAWNRYWAPLFSASVDAETRVAAGELAVQRSVDDLITGVRAFHDRRDSSGLLRGWGGSVLLISGAEDRTPTPAVAAASMVGAEFDQLVVEDAGHYVPLEQPDRFRRILGSAVSIDVNDTVLRESTLD